MNSIEMPYFTSRFLLRRNDKRRVFFTLEMAVNEPARKASFLLPTNPNEPRVLMPSYSWYSLIEKSNSHNSYKVLTLVCCGSLISFIALHTLVSNENKFKSINKIR